MQEACLLLGVTEKAEAHLDVLSMLRLAHM